MKHLILFLNLGFTLRTLYILTAKWHWILLFRYDERVRGHERHHEHHSTMRNSPPRHSNSVPSQSHRERYPDSGYVKGRNEHLDGHCFVLHNIQNICFFFPLKCNSFVSIWKVITTRAGFWILLGLHLTSCVLAAYIVTTHQMWENNFSKWNPKLLHLREKAKLCKHAQSNWPDALIFCCKARLECKKIIHRIKYHNIRHHLHSIL